MTSNQCAIFSRTSNECVVSDSFLKLNLQHGYRYLSETGSFPLGFPLTFPPLEPALFVTWAGATDAVVLADSTGKIIYANPGVTTHCYGFEEEEQKIAI